MNEQRATQNRSLYRVKRKKEIKYSMEHVSIRIKIFIYYTFTCRKQRNTIYHREIIDINGDEYALAIVINCTTPQKQINILIKKQTILAQIFDGKPHTICV